MGCVIYYSRSKLCPIILVIIANVFLTPHSKAADLLLLGTGELIIGFCFHSYDAEYGMNRLEMMWCSKASIKQRAGRVGRVRAGVAIRLFPRSWFETKLLDFDPAEIHRCVCETIKTIPLIYYPHNYCHGIYCSFACETNG